MDTSLFNRLLNALPRSAGQWIGRRFGFRSQPITAAAAPVWERVTAGPLVGREILIDFAGASMCGPDIASRSSAPVFQLHPPRQHSFEFRPNRIDPREHSSNVLGGFLIEIGRCCFHLQSRLLGLERLDALGQ